MPVVWDVVGFLAKAVIVVAALAFLLSLTFALFRRGRADGTRLTVRRLNTRMRDLTNALRAPVLGHRRFRKVQREEHRRQKQLGERPKVFVLDYHGDIAATATSNLRHEITAVLGVAQDKDEVVLRLESSGGIVHGYGLAASQLVRLRQRKLKLTICVDKVAASGGYMMACVADEVVAAPFAIIGSIGVVASVPNVNRLLQEHGVDYEEMTAGEFKRTVSYLGKISPEGRQKFQEQLEDTHALFKEFVKAHRPDVQIDAVSTGEYWFARRARELGLVDRLETSDDLLLSRMEVADVFQVTYREPQPLRRRVVSSVGDALAHGLVRVFDGAAARTPFG